MERAVGNHRQSNVELCSLILHNITVIEVPSLFLVEHIEPLAMENMAMQKMENDT